ncbi:MAG: peptidylprolyl isomerase [Candidatus Acidiferrales bacterium]
MLKSIQNRDRQGNRWIKITMGALLVLISLSMLTYLIPGLGTSAMSNSPDAAATVGGDQITVADVQKQLNTALRGQDVPPMLRGLYAKQVLDQMVFQHALEIEGQRLGLSVTPEEMTQRIKQILPTAWNGDMWLKDRYTTEVQTRLGMTVEDFERFLRDQMLQEKFHQLVTDSITVSPEEVQQEFRRRNEKVQIDYALVKPADWAASIQPSDADLNAYYTKNMSKYQVPEKRSAHYALLDPQKLAPTVQVSDADLQAYYNDHIDEYKIENRVHAEHILFKTVGKTDAEIAEIKQKAEDVLKKAKAGANFEDLAKKYSEDDASKVKGGDLGWIVEGQTVPAFQQAAFTLPSGSISPELVKTEYGFHIIKVLDHEQARTKPLDEVRSTIAPAVLFAKVNAKASDIANQMAAAVRQSNHQSLDDLAKKFNLETGDTPLVGAADPMGVLGNSPELHASLFELGRGELSQPIQTEHGFVIITPKDIQPAHQGTLAEVRDKVLADDRQDKAGELAKSKVEQLAKQAQGGEDFTKAAKSLDLDVQTPAAFTRTGDIPGLGSAQSIDGAFNLPVGQISTPKQVSGGWLVYKVVEHDSADPAELILQSDQIKQQLLQSKQAAAYDAFRTALEDRLKKEGKLSINPDALKRLTSAT